MQGIHIHTPEWLNPHKPDWHSVGVHFGHLIHDPRFWATIALAILLGLMVLAVIFSKPTGEGPMMPIYPMGPYVP